jgi:putative transposase
VLTDRAREFKSEHLQQISLQLGFQRRLRAFPAAGGLVESHFDKINKEYLSEKPGYTGSNIDERPKEAERTACLTLDDLERELVRYFVDHANQHFYSEDKLTVAERMNKPKRFERWKNDLLVEPEVLNERELDICLMKSLPCKVEKYGCLRFKRLRYQGDCLASKALVGKWVMLRYDQRNIATLLVYSFSTTSQVQEFIGLVQAIGLEREQFSLGEWEALKQKMREQDKEADNSILIAERMGLIEDTQEQIKGSKSKRQRIKKAHTEQARKTNRSKVVELYPERATTGETASSKNIELTPNIPLQKEVESTPAEQLQQPAVKRRRVQGVISDWHQFMQDNW